MKNFLLFLLILIIFPLASVSAKDSNPVDIDFFYGRGCPHCLAMQSFLFDMQKKYTELSVLEHEVYFDNENRKVFQEMMNVFGGEIQGVPTAFIDDKVMVGFSNAIAGTMENEIQRCIAEGCTSPMEKLAPLQQQPVLKEVLPSPPVKEVKVVEEQIPEQLEQPSEIVQIIGDSSPSEEPGKTKIINQLTIPAVIFAAVVDAINPCAFAVLIILLTTILAAHSRRKALFSGLAFSSSIFISYLLMGVGLYSAIQVSGISSSFYVVVATLAILIGLFNLKDYLWYGKWFVMEVPMSWRPKLKMLLNGVTSAPGAFLIGFVISLFLLPCTSGPYIVILGLLSEVATRNVAFAYLVLYNFIFVLPMLVITLAVYYGITTTERAEEWRLKKLKNLHLIAGAIILLLGIGMFSAMVLGML
ncbi:MAG: hypothetical protein ABIG69_15070 [Bacteroidota bacterium]|nr:cytochrome c biogenesis protein [Patescibacteria group bacterium]